MIKGALEIKTDAEAIISFGSIVITFNNKGIGFPYETAWNDISLNKYSYVDSVMTTKKITGEFLYKDQSLLLLFSKLQYVTYDNQRYYLLKPPTVSQNLILGEDSSSQGMVKYTCEFSDESALLSNIPFTDTALPNTDENAYRNGSRTWYFFGTITELQQRINACLQENAPGSGWTCALQAGFIDDGKTPDAPILFDNITIADALKTAYDTYDIPYIFSNKTIYIGSVVTEIDYTFELGQGLGLKNNNRTPKNNTVITRLSGQGSEQNLPYRYPIIKDNDGAIIDHPYYRSRLMPTVYAESVRKRVKFDSVDYNPNEPLVDYIDADDTYPTPANPYLPLYGNQTFEDIKPTIVGAKNLDEQAIDEIKNVPTPEGGWDDYVDKGTGDLRQSYFQMELYPLGFDIWACAAVVGTGMAFNMKSGACQGSTFSVAVDDALFKSNFYREDEDGKLIFDPALSTRDYTLFPDSTSQSIILTLSKDIETWGKNAMQPNQWQIPTTGDKFVILDIELPQAYIDQAQIRLDEAMAKYLRENNYDKYEYPLDFDSFFFQSRPDILAQINTNSIVRFKYLGEVIRLGIQAITINYGDSALPKYDITLTDEIAINLNAVTKNAENIAQLEYAVGQQTTKATRQNESFYSGIKKVLQGVFDSEGDNRIDDLFARVIYANAALFGQNSNNFGLYDCVINSQSLSTLNLSSGSLEHFWSEAPFTNKHWDIGSANLVGLNEASSYYVYIKANRSDQNAVWEVSANQYKYDANIEYWYFLAGQSIVTDSGRVFYATNGLTAILGGNISAQTIQGANYSELAGTGMLLDFLRSRIYMGDGAQIISKNLSIEGADDNVAAYVKGIFGVMDSNSDTDISKVVLAISGIEDDNIAIACHTVDAYQKAISFLAGVLLDRPNFLLDKAGKAYMQGADINGKIVSTEGNIGGFEITESMLSSDDGENQLELSAYLIKFIRTIDGVSVGLGANNFPPEAGAIICPENIEVSNSVGVYKINAGIRLSVEGATNFDNPDYVKMGNHALWIDKGDICGFRLKSRRVTYSPQTLSYLDSVLLVTNSSNTTIHLPENPQNGQLYMIRRCNNINITIQCPAGQTITYTDLNAATSSKTLNSWKELTIHWDSANSVWWGSLSETQT